MSPARFACGAFLSMYRQAKPTEIAKCVRKQIVEPLDNTEGLRPKELRKMVEDVRLCAISIAEWLEAQKSQD